MRDSVVFDWEKVVDTLAEKILAGTKNVAIYGWYGIDYGKIAKSLASRVENSGKTVTLIHRRTLSFERGDRFIQLASCNRRPRFRKSQQDWRY